MKELTELKPLEMAVTQPFFSAGIQVYQIIDWVVSQTGPVHVMNTTFSVAEEFLRAVFRLKNKGLIISSIEVADLKSAAKTAKINDLLRAVFDKVYLAENHSKVVLLYNEKIKVAIITSQNQTRGNRHEAGIITTDGEIFSQLFDEISKMIESKSVKWSKGEPLPQTLT